MIEKIKSMNNDKTRSRLIFFIIFMVLLVILLVVRLGHLMLFLPEAGEVSGAPEIERGHILDRNGKILAIQTKLFSVTASLPEIENIEETASLLSGILSMEETGIIEILQKKAQFAYIKRKVAQGESDRIQDLINAGKLEGINLNPESARSYPKKSLAAHIVGIAGTDNIGLEGLEWEFNQELYPSPGKNTGEEKIYGNQLFLTLDLNVQYYINEIADKAYREHEADSVMILVMGAQTGKILGSSSLPGYNPNNFTQYSESDRMNRPITVAYEPGSVFKVFTIASFLELGALSNEDTFICNGYYDRVDPAINCLGIHNEVNPQRIIKYSCNVGAAFASESVTSGDFYRMLLSFGFGKKSGIPMPGESAGILSHPSGWSGRSKPTIAFGQEISVSAIQVVTAATALTNKGILLKPKIIEKIVSPEGQLLKEFPREPVRRVLSERTAREMLLFMEDGTTDGGTAHRGAIDGIRISAKTGTAQVRNPETGKYSDKHYISSFLGIFPTENPELIIYVVINNPRGEAYYGSRIAAPIFKEAAEKLIPLLDINNDNSTTVSHTGEINLPRPGTIVIGEIMPDLKGVPKRQLLPLFAREDITIHIKGNGFVRRQDPLPGAEVKPGTKIVLELE